MEKEGCIKGNNFKHFFFTPLGIHWKKFNAYPQRVSFLLFISKTKTYYLKLVRNSSGVWLVLDLNSLLKDCECSNSNSKAFLLTESWLVERCSLALSISLKWMYCRALYPIIQLWSGTYLLNIQQKYWVDMSVRNCSVDFLCCNVCYWNKYLK